MKSIVYAVLILFIAHSVLNAGNLASVNFLGFSDDGKFAAFEQYWIQDGSGFPEAEIIIISTCDNSVVESYKTSWSEEMMYVDGVELYYENSSNPAREIVQQSARSLLDSLDISPVNQGIHCISHPLTDTGVEEEYASFVPWASSRMWSRPEYNLSIINHEVMPDSPPEWLSMFETPVLLELIITDSNGDEVMHLIDDSPISGYEYVSSYRIRDVYVFNDAVAIILNAIEPGFEGQDFVFRMVTGVIEGMD